MPENPGNVASVLKKFQIAKRQREAEVEVTVQEVRTFIRWVRDTEYDLENGPVNLICQGYAVGSCDEPHRKINGRCDCVVWLVLDDFEGEDSDEVDIAPWWYSFRLINNCDYRSQ